MVPTNASHEVVSAGIYDLFAGDKGDLLSGEEASDLEGEMTATITEISIPNRTCQRLYRNSTKGRERLKERERKGTKGREKERKERERNKTYRGRKSESSEGKREGLKRERERE